MMLLTSLTNLYGQTKHNSPSTGNFQDTLIAVPLSTVKLATIKLIERNEYIEICSQKDSIIDNYKKYISLQNNQIENLKFENYQLMEQNDDYVRINEDIAESLIKQKRLSAFAGGIASVGVITTLILIFLK